MCIRDRHTSVAQVEVSGGLLLFVSVSCEAFIIKFVHDLGIKILCFRPVSKHDISDLLMSALASFKKHAFVNFQLA